MSDTVRLRQVALVARELGPVADRLQNELGLADPFHDRGVGEFGLVNAVFAVGDTFIEIVAPIRPNTTAGRLLAKRGGDGGYMAIFQVPELAEARQRIGELGLRVVWTGDLDDMAGTHLHPKDVPGAIVSLDWADPPESWRWAGPAWRGRAPSEPDAGGIRGLTVGAQDFDAVARRWAEVLGVADGLNSSGQRDAHGSRRQGADGGGVGLEASAAEDAMVEIDGGRQFLRFQAPAPGRIDGICEVALDLTAPRRRPGDGVEIGGVRFVFMPDVHRSEESTHENTGHRH